MPLPTATDPFLLRWFSHDTASPMLPERLFSPQMLARMAAAEQLLRGAVPLSVLTTLARAEKTPTVISQVCLRADVMPTCARVTPAPVHLDAQLNSRRALLPPHALPLSPPLSPFLRFSPLSHAE